ncbi:MAG TPA: GAF domain-containing protein [Phenylobacterium sp.]|nr:GAF domain-containing protein [Phenylobacterium sp.]
MSIPLRRLGNCFEGVIPSIVATLDTNGIPNVSYLSQVHMVDDDHVALSNQFFSKTLANVQETGRASVLVVDGRNGDQYELDLEFERATQSGETFARIALHIEATAAQHGSGIAWGLRSADIYRVVDCRAVPSPPDVADEPVEPVRGDILPAAARVVSDIAAAADPDAMLDRVLDGLTQDFGYSNAIVLVMDGRGDRLTTLGSRGYPLGGVGSETPLGLGAIGMAAATGRPVRISDMSRGRRFAAAVRGDAGPDPSRIIPLPGLAEPQSQLAAPMISHAQTRGVLFVEDEQRFRFTQADEDILVMIAAQLAACLRLWDLEGAGGSRPASDRAQAAAPGPAFRVRYYAFDDSLFIDDAYLIKGVPGRLLFYFLTAHSETGRVDFTNRELRLDAALRLPDLKDNLETRLILLRRRLEEKAAPVRLTRPGRGHIRLELSGVPHLEVVAGPA